MAAEFGQGGTDLPSSKSSPLSRAVLTEDMEALEYFWILKADGTLHAGKGGAATQDHCWWALTRKK